MRAQPESLEGWTLEALHDLVDHGVFESDRLEFKQAFPTDDDGKERLRVTIAALANATGGIILFGVKDNRTTGRDRLVGIDPSIDFPERFAAQARHLVPSIDWDFVKTGIRLPGGRIVHVAEITKSSRGPHAVLVDGYPRFPRRTHASTEPMSVEELRGAFSERNLRRREVQRVLTHVHRLSARAIDLNREAGARRRLPSRWTLERLRPSGLEAGYVVAAETLRSVDDIGDGLERFISFAHQADRALEVLSTAPRPRFVPAEDSGRIQATREDLREVASQLATLATGLPARLERIVASL